jgi:hypothetical protein
MNYNNNRQRRRTRVIAAIVVTVGLVAACGGRALDPAVVGTYDFTIPGGRWRLTIAGDGTYSFVTEAGGAPAHSGTFSADNGEWSMRATTMELVDGGRYTVAAGGLELTGNRGTLYWRRSPDATATAATPAPPPEAAPALSPAATTVPAPPTPAATAVAAAPVASSPAVATIDPCLLVTEPQASRLLGDGVVKEASTPQPRTQNDCLYRVNDTTNRTLAVHAYNGDGIDPAGYLERRRATGGQPLPGIGDGALITYREVTGLTSVDFVLGRITVEILVSGVPRERADPEVRRLAYLAVERLKTGAAAFRMPGRERFVGTWLVTGSVTTPRTVMTVAGDGRVTVETYAAAAGTMLLDGSRWRIEDGQTSTLRNGEYRLVGDRLALTGEVLTGELTRVACRTPPKMRAPPYIFTRDIASYLNGEHLSRLQLRTGGTTAFDPHLAGLWEGEVTTGGMRMPMLLSLDQSGRTTLAVFPVIRGGLEARDGNFRLALDGFGETTGTYRFHGGINDNLIETVDEEETLTWTPHDPQPPRSATAVVGHCY